MTLRTATPTRFQDWPKSQYTPQPTPPKPAAPISLVIDAAAYTYDVTHEQLLGPTRKQPYMWIRQTAHWLAYQLTDSSYEVVGRAFKRHHTNAHDPTGRARSRTRSRVTASSSSQSTSNTPPANHKPNRNHQ